MNHSQYNQQAPEKKKEKAFWKRKGGLGDVYCRVSPVATFRAALDVGWGNLFLLEKVSPSPQKNIRRKKP